MYRDGVHAVPIVISENSFQTLGNGLDTRGVSKIHAQLNINPAPRSNGYREVIASRSNHPDALHLLGLIASDAGRHETAAALIVRAIEVGGPKPLFCANLGVALTRQGKTGQAIACYKQALRETPPMPPRMPVWAALYWPRAGSKKRARRFAKAPVCGRARRKRISSWATLCTQWVLTRRPRSLTCAPSSASRYTPRPATIWESRAPFQLRQDEAIAAYKRAIRIRPDYPEPHNNLATLMQALRRYDRAVDHYSQALRIAPQSADVRYNLALLDQDRDHLEQAAENYRQVLGQKPDHTEARNNLGNTLLALGRPGEAISCYRQTLDHNPGSVEAHWNLGVAHLVLGALEQGWPGYEWRLRQKDAAARVFPQPRWDGSPLDGRRILLHAEQGLGDTLQFVRYAPLVKQRGGHVILECQLPLRRLLAGLQGVDELVARGGALPSFDCHAPLLSLPGIFKTGPDTIPAEVPYLHVARAELDRWRGIIAGRLKSKPCLKVGLTWAGNSRPQERQESEPAAC